MANKKKPAKTTAAGGKEELPDPATVKSGTSTTYVGGWSSFETIETVSAVSAQVTAAHTNSDGVVEPLSRTNILLLPDANASVDQGSSSGAAADTEQPLSVEVIDQMNIEGVSRQLCGRAEGATKMWAAPAAAAAAPTDETAPASSDDAAQPVPTDPPQPPVNPFEDALSDARYSQTVAVGATYAARDVVVSGSCSIEGRPPKIVVPPQLPAKPDLDAVTLDEPAASAAEVATGKGKKPTSAAGKGAKKGKVKLTPEQLEELERKKAAVEAEYLQQTEQAVQRAQEEADYLMTFAHPDRWAHVVFRHLTFAGPVVVRRAHVSFQNCRFTSAVADRPQLLVSQYCRVNCTKCTFEAPQRCGVYALPSAQVTVRKCLFTGVAQAVLWAANVPGLSPQSGGAAAEINANDVHADGGNGGLDEEMQDGDGAAAASHHNGSNGRAGSLPLTASLKDVVQSAFQQRAGAVGIQTDSAKAQVQSCSFVALGVGVYIRGSFSVYVSHRAVVPKPAQQLTLEACDVALDANSFHHFANTAVLLDKTARLVGLRRNFVEVCAYYGLDCQGGSKSVLVRNNQFTADAVVRIREGASVTLLHNDFKIIPIDDNPQDNPCLQPAY